MFKIGVDSQKKYGMFHATMQGVVYLSPSFVYLKVRLFQAFPLVTPGLESLVVMFAIR